MDGLDIDSLAVLSTAHHDIAPTPDGGFYYIAGAPSGACDAIYKFPGNSLVYDLTLAFPSYNHTTGGINGDSCHVNSIHLSEFDDSVTVSSALLDAFVNVGEDGTLRWVLGSADSDFELGTLSWNVNFGFHRVSEEEFVFFENAGGPLGGGPIAGSIGHVLTLDETNGTISSELAYAPGTLNSSVFGDALKLPNGNYLFVFSTQGIFQEVTPEGTLVREYQYGEGPFATYVDYRSWLYGPPLR
jgi:hypothetical protein